MLGYFTVDKKTYAHIEDKELIERFYAERNNQWLGILLERYTLLLFGVCMKYLKNEEEAKDTVQQIFLKVVIEIGKYKVDYFKSWLYMIAKNSCLMKIREKSGKIPVELIDDLHYKKPALEFNKSEVIEKDIKLSYIEEGLNELNEEQKECITLFYLKKYSYQQIAERTGFSLLQVKSYIQNGKRNLKQIVEKKLKTKYG